jgi:hypothetical protein
MTDGRPSVFISYQHGDKPVARALADGLEAAGLQVWIDENELLVGGSLIEQLATAVEGVDFFVALVSPNSVASRWCQKEISMALSGGMGREGVRVLPVRVGNVEMPATLRDQVWLDLDPEDVEETVRRLDRDVRRYRERKNEVGANAMTREPEAPRRERPSMSPEQDDDSEPIRIIGVVKEGVSEPRNDGTAGSALYRIPLRLSRRPPAIWRDAFPEAWNHPPQWTTMHRPGIASVQGDTIVLDGTTMDELETVHVTTLKLVIDKLNRDVADALERERVRQELEERARESHRDEVDNIAGRLNFD